MLKVIALSLVPVIFGGCGGGAGATEHEVAVQRAAAEESEARRLGVATPCSAATECAALSFLQAAVPCPNYVYQPYSLVSASAAAASAAAAEQRVLAGQAAALAPPTGIACIALVNSPPTLACVASTCRVVK